MKQVCYIGGAAGLIGQSVLERFQKEGHHVFGLDKERSRNCHQVDLSNEEKVEDFFHDHFEKAEHSVLINCQAIADPHVGPLWKLESSKWKDYMDANLNSYFHTCKHFIKRFIENNGKSASIINLSSTRRLMAEPNTEPYCATKGAITSFSRALAISAGAHGIRVNGLSPGWIAPEDADLREIDHAQHPAGRAGRPSDVARACLFLADKKNSFLTGQDLVIDGGMTAKMIYED